MQNKRTSFIIFVLLNGSTLLAGLYFNSHEFLFMLSAAFAIGIFALFTSPMVGFALLIAYVLGHGFYSVGSAWGKELSSASQSVQIFKQCIYSLSAVAAWFLIYSMNKTREGYLSLEKEAAELRKLEPLTGILTFNEFMEGAKLLITGLRRRKEKAYYLLFDASNPKEYQQRVIYEKLTKLLLQSVRVNYDLVGHAGSSRVILFLSNTNEDGVRIVLNRLFQSMEHEANMTPDDFIYSVHEVSDDFEVFSDAVSAWKRREAS